MRAITLYSLLAGGILGWWALAFHSTLSPKQSGQTPPAQPLLIDTASTIYLSPLERDTLRQALAGDFALAARLISDWQIDAALYEAHGFQNVRKLSEHDFLRSQSLSRELLRNNGRSKNLRFLPQTYASASFLLAIANPEQIVALPRGLRKQIQMYPESITSLIPMDIDRYQHEKLYLQHPDIAFVSAHYSHPSVIQMLQNLGIKIHATQSQAKLTDITQNLLQIGKAAEREKEAEFLALFIEASLRAIENRLLLNDRASNPARVLYAHYYDRFYLPSHDTVAWELLQRLGISNTLLTTNSGSLSREQILHLNPDCILVSTNHPADLQRMLETDPVLGPLNASGQCKILMVDDEIQQSPTQYVVLAFYDLAHALQGIQ